MVGRAAASSAVLLPMAAALLLTARPRAVHGQPARTDSASPAADVATIRALRASSNDAIARHDTAGIGAILAPHVVVISSTSAQSIGRQAMLTSFAQHFVDRPDVTYRRTPTEIRVFAPWAMAREAGEWRGSWTEADGMVRIGGRYFAKWRQIGGRWLVESETFVPEWCEGSAYCRRAP